MRKRINKLTCNDNYQYIQSISDKNRLLSNTFKLSPGNFIYNIETGQNQFLQILLHVWKLRKNIIVMFVCNNDYYY